MRTMGNDKIMLYTFSTISTHMVTSSNGKFSALLAILRGIHRSPVNSPHKGLRRGALMSSFICAWINDWVNNGEAGDLRRHRTHYDVTVMISSGDKDHRMYQYFMGNTLCTGNYVCSNMKFECMCVYIWLYRSLWRLYDDLNVGLV